MASGTSFRYPRWPLSSLLARVVDRTPDDVLQHRQGEEKYYAKHTTLLLSCKLYHYSLNITRNLILKKSHQMV